MTTASRAPQPYHDLDIAATKRGARVKIRVKPGARRQEIAGVHGGALKVSVGAVAEKGRANEELLVFLAASLRVPRAAVHVSSGSASRSKHVEIEGLSPQDVRSRLALLLEPARHGSA